METSTKVNKRVTALEEHVTSIFQALGGHERVTLHPILFESIAVVDYVIRKIQQLEAKMDVPGSFSTIEDGLAAKVAFLKETISTLMDLKKDVFLIKKAFTNPSNNDMGREKQDSSQGAQTKTFLRCTIRKGVEKLSMGC